MKATPWAHLLLNITDLIPDMCWNFLAVGQEISELSDLSITLFHCNVFGMKTGKDRKIKKTEIACFLFCKNDPRISREKLIIDKCIEILE